MAGVARAVARQTAPLPRLVVRQACFRQLGAVGGGVRALRASSGARLKLNNAHCARRSFSHSAGWRSVAVPGVDRGGSKLWESADEAVADVRSGSVLLSSGFGLCGVACKFRGPETEMGWWILGELTRSSDTYRGASKPRTRVPPLADGRVQQRRGRGARRPCAADRERPGRPHDHVVPGLEQEAGAPVSHGQDCRRAVPSGDAGGEDTRGRERHPGLFYADWRS